MDHQPDVTFDEVLGKAGLGDPRALDSLVRLLEGPLVGFLRARGAEDADGLADEVLVQMCRRVGHFDGNEAQFRAWVFTIARNRLIDQRRHHARRPALVPTSPAELVSWGGAYEAPDHASSTERVDALLGNLTDEQREVVVLRIIAGLSVEETARVVARRPGAVRALQHRALQLLRKNLSATP